ncbi:MAG TPA: GAF domain-containing protein [Labilithrix sp.]|jgi:hypothetical protein|nr:GAF domain-containing protein [Labilithrix sp.]
MTLPSQHTANTTEGVSRHSMASDALARSVLQALLDTESLGVALLRAGDWNHVLTNRAYDEALSNNAPTLDKNFFDIVAPAVVPRSVVEAVVSTGRAVHIAKASVMTRSKQGSLVRRYFSMSFLPMRAGTSDVDRVLVLVRDVSTEVHEQRIAELFVLLARDMTAERDEAATIRSSVTHATEALGAATASIFLLAPDEKSLHGALVGWDWTRSSFVANVDEWPNVEGAISKNEACFLTGVAAKKAEEGWFERRGIQAAVCAPMAVGDRVLGVLFFDYPASAPSGVDLALAKTVADQCALLVERAAAHVPLP